MEAIRDKEDIFINASYWNIFIVNIPIAFVCLVQVLNSLSAGALSTAQFRRLFENNDQKETGGSVQFN